MSELPAHLAAQRISVRLLHDAVWRAKVYANPERELAPYKLPPALVASLIRPDTRAYGVDSHRAERVARAQIDEYLVSVALLALAGVPPQKLTRFVSSEAFHTAIMTRGRLVLAFERFLSEQISAARRQRGADLYLLGVAAEMVRVEAGIAALRREHDGQPCACTPNPFEAPRSSCSGLVQVWRARVIQVLPGLLELWQSLREQLLSLAEGDVPLAPILDARLRRLKVARNVKLKAVSVPLLIELDAHGEPGLAEASEELALVLEAARQPCEEQALITQMVPTGLTELEARDILTELLTDGVLRHLPSPEHP